MFKQLLDPQLINSRIHLSLLILRISTGALMLTHGFPKFLKLLNGDLRFADPIGLGMESSLVLAVLGEFGGSLLILSGLWTRIGAFLGGSTMLVAALIQHANDPIGTKEKALLFLAAYIVIFIAGPGKYSVDSRLR